MVKTGSDSGEKEKRLIAALAEYVSVLETSLEATTRAEDRNRYRDHLASAALIFAALQKQHSNQKMKELVASCQHSYGWDYLSGDEGRRAEMAFDSFARLVDEIT